MLLKSNTCDVYISQLIGGKALSYEKMPSGRVVNCREHENVNVAIKKLNIWCEWVEIPGKQSTLNIPYLKR